MLALKLLLRNWRGGQLGLIFWSLVFAVAVVTSITLLAERVELALVKESSSFLAADQLVRSSKPIDSQWFAEAKRQGVDTAQAVVFNSMVYHGEENHLASVKAVDGGYPLRGVLKLSTTPFATDPALIKSFSKGPAPGEAWVDARLLPLLDIELGEQLEVGEVALTVTHTLVEEPDRGDTYSLFGARVLMNWQDLAAAGVIQPGSRVSYRFLVAAAETDQLNAYITWLKPQLDVHQHLISPDQAQASIADTMSRGRRFLLLAGSIGVVLAGIALALASRHFASGQLLPVALLKSWGISKSRVRSLYGQQSLWLGLMGSLVGLLVGYGFHELLIAIAREWLPLTLPAAGWHPWLIGLSTGLLCLVGFTLPALWHLPAQSPLAVLRQEVKVKPVGAVLRGLLGIATIAVLLLWYSNSPPLLGAMLAGFAFTALASMAVGLLLLRLGKNYGHWVGSIWRLALANLWRRKSQSLVQIVGFAWAIALLMVMVVIRTSLIDEWRWQLADDAPNHFLMNVAPHELEGVESLITERQLETADWYAMVRGRITHINGEKPTEAMKDRNESLRRELNLSWSTQLPEDNQLVTGSWWDGLEPSVLDRASQLAPVSIEVDLASEIGLSLGDQLNFSVGGLSFKAVVTSIRSLNWDNMTPNFYFLFPEGILENYPRTSITSLYIPPREKLLVNDLLRQYPTIHVIELDKIIDRIRTIISQVTHGLELMTLLILGCGVLVMFAAVNLSMGERLHESAILRTMGGSQRLILGVQLMEFSSLGVMAGLLAAAGAELAVTLLQQFMFDLPFKLHFWLWLVGPIGGGLLVGAIGVGYSRKVVVQPPLEVLRGLS